jgi:hypothetical protein
MHRKLLTAYAIASSLFAALAHSSDWTQFRGPNNSGVVADSQAPTEWSKDQNLAWERTIPGYGWSSPIVVGDKLIVTAASSDKQERPHPVLAALASAAAVDLDLRAPMDRQTAMAHRTATGLRLALVPRAASGLRTVRGRQPMDLRAAVLVRRATTRTTPRETGRPVVEKADRAAPSARADSARRPPRRMRSTAGRFTASIATRATRSGPK